MQELNRFVKNASDEGKWITIKPHGEDSEDYRRLKLEKGETPKQAIERVYKKNNIKDNEKKEYKEKIRTLTIEKYNKKQMFEKLERGSVKLYKVYQNLANTRFMWDESKVASKEDIDCAYEDYSKKADEKFAVLHEYNITSQKLSNLKANYLQEFQNKNIEKVLKTLDTENIVKDFENLNEEYNFEKLVKDFDNITKQIDKKKEEWKSIINSAKSADEQNKKIKEYENWFYNDELNKKSKELIDKLNNFKVERNKAISKILQTKNGGEFKLKTTKGGTLTAKVEMTNELLSGIINKDFIPNFSPIAKGFNGNRAFANGNTIHLNSLDSVYTSIHECMHWLEGVNPEMLANSKAFLKYRTKNDEIKTLKDLTGNKNYKSDENAKADKFFSPYCGKEYETATEIMSMGVQRLFEHPDKFYKEDREYFNFVIGNLRGEL